MKKAPTKQNALVVFENVTGGEKLKKFEEGLEEGYDVMSDELYSVWIKMKQLSLCDDQNDQQSNTQATGDSNDPDFALVGQNPVPPSSNLPYP